MFMRKEEIIQSIRDTAKQIMPIGSKVILFGSQARGDAHEESDWDVLVLLDKDKLEEADHDNYSYPLFELGWHIDAQIHPMLYTVKDWSTRNFSPFYKNVQQDGIVLC